MNLVVARVGAKGRLFAQVDDLCIDWGWAMDIASSKRLIIWFEINLLSSNERFQVNICFFLIRVLSKTTRLEKKKWPKFKISPKYYSLYDMKV